MIAQSINFQEVEMLVKPARTTLDLIHLHNVKSKKTRILTHGVNDQSLKGFGTRNEHMWYLIADIYSGSFDPGCSRNSLYWTRRIC